MRSQIEASTGALRLLISVAKPVGDEAPQVEPPNLHVINARRVPP